MLIGHISKTHLLKVSLDLLLIERLGQQVRYVQHEVDSLLLDELLLKVFTYDVKLLLYIFRLLVRLGLLSKGYGTVVVTVQYNGI